MRKFLGRSIPVLCALWFTIIGLAFLPLAGIQNDEALFASGIFEQVGLSDSIEVAGHRIPLMLMSYLGSFKSWIYTPIFHFWQPSQASLRLPVILIGAMTVWLFGSLLRRIGGERAAAVGSILLATDTLFLLTTCYDWGPVALQHLLTVGAVLCLVRFHQEGKRRFLAGGFLMLGLALWDKALFAWILSGMTIGALLVFPRELRKCFRLHHLYLATVAFCLGSAPLITYNTQHKFETFRSNARYSAGDIPGKTYLLRLTLEGRALFGYFFRNDPAGHPRSAQTAAESSATWLSDKTGAQQINFFRYAVIGALLLTPWLWFTPARRPLVFSLIAMSIAWLQMLLTKDAGGAVHHVILLWPFPAFFVAIAFSEASRRLRRVGPPLLGVVVAVVAGSSLLLTNQYYVDWIRNGTSAGWTDAITPLSHSLAGVKSNALYMDDWGMLDALRMLSRGALQMREGSDPLSKPELDARDKAIVLSRLEEPEAFFVGHSDGNEMFAGVNAKLRAVAEQAGYDRVVVAEIADQNGRVIFEVVRFKRGG